MYIEYVSIRSHNSKRKKEKGKNNQMYMHICNYSLTDLFKFVPKNMTTKVDMP